MNDKTLPESLTHHFIFVINEMSFKQKFSAKDVTKPSHSSYPEITGKVEGLSPSTKTR